MTISVRLIRVWRASLSDIEILSAILEGLKLRISFLRSCMNNSNPRSLSLLGVQVLFFLKGLGPEHTLKDVQVIPLLHVNSNRDSIRFSMEQHLIDKAGTLQNGINRTCDH